MDAFIGFCVILGTLQILYCGIVGTFPKNSFLSGIIAPFGAALITGIIINKLKFTIYKNNIKLYFSLIEILNKSLNQIHGNF